MKKFFQMTNARKIILIFFITVVLILPSVALAVDLTVTVKERGTGNLLEGATVVIGEGELYKTTPENGRVSFSEITLPVEIKILALGYDKFSKVFKKINNNNITLYIYPLVFEGEGLVVTADRVIEKSSKFTLSKEDLVSSAGSQGDPLKAIAALPGIISAGESSAEVYMRGSNTNENIVWINRAPVGYLYHFGGFQSVINPSLVEDINVFLGGFPVEYGDALGGVIDVKLRAPKNDRLHYRYDISTIISSFLVEGPVSEDSEDSFFVAARRSYLDLLFSPDKFNKLAEDDEEDDPDQFTLVPRFYDAQALYRHVLKKGYIDTFFFAAGDKLKIDVRGSAASDPQLAGLASNSREFQTAGTTWQQFWNNKWDSTMTFSYANDKSSISLGRDENGEPFFANIESNDIFWQPELHWQRQRDEKFTFGLETFYAKAPLDLFISRLPREEDPNFDFTSKKKFRVKENLYIKSYAPYLKYRKQWAKNWVTTLGLRFSSIAVTGGFRAQEISPRTSLEYTVSEDTLLTATWGRYVQTPDALEIVDQFGNPGLEITEAEHRVLGVQHRINSLYSLKTEIYHKPMKNLVVAIDENEPPDIYANEGTGKAYGVDIFLKREAYKNVKGWLALSWAKSRRTNELTKLTRDFEGDQPVTLTAVWGQPFGGNWNRWDWSVKAQVRSGNPYTKVIGRNREDPNDPNSRFIPEFGKHNGERLPTYFKVDLRIAKEILYTESKMKIYLDIQNVTFRKNVSEFDYGNEYERIDNPREITGIGFFPFVGVQYEY